MKGHYENLLDKLDRFVRKYYVNELIKGGLYTISLGVLCFLLFALAENFFYFDPGVRKVLFFSFVGLTLFMLFRWIAVPLGKYFKLGNRISHEQAAVIIGEHFADVQDKLLNILQLKKGADPGNQLAMASIEQKTSKIAPIRFQTAIDLKKNKRYLPYAVPPLMILLALLVAAPSLITDPTHRIIHNNEVFEREAPFHFTIQNNDLTVPQYEDFTLDVKVEGDALPKQVYIDINGFQYRMKGIRNDHYRYTFKNVQERQAFYMQAEGVRSGANALDGLLKPSILTLGANIDYPAYTGQRDEIKDNVGDLVVPEGSTIQWEVVTENTTDVAYAFGSAPKAQMEKNRNGNYAFEKRIRNNDTYKLTLGNEALPNNDSVEYTIQVIKDQYPSINVKTFVDSSDLANIFLAGTVADDYGIRRLTFQYEILNEQNQQKKSEIIDLDVSTNSRTAPYDYIFNVDSLKLEAGDQVIYFFEVFDNDAVNGSKSVKSDIKQLRKPTKEEFEEKEEQNEDDINKALAEAKKKSDDINKDLKELRDKLIQEKEMSWQMKQDLENLMERQQQLNQEVQEAEEKFKENLENQKEFSEPSEALQEKQEQLEKLFEEVQDPEAQELMEKINELMQELDREMTLEMLEQMDLEEMEFNMDLERLQELFKQLELERDMMQQTEKLEELAKEQQELSEETEQQNEETSPEEQEALTEKQEDINEAFEDIKEELEKLQERNEAMENPKSMEDPSEQTEDIESDLEESLEQLQQQQNDNASESQQNAAEKMEQLASELQQQMQAGQMEQMQEDMKSMRQLLENLIGMSFEQEDLISEVQRTKKQTPKFTDLVQQQYKLKGDFGLIEDSLQALSKRVVQIESFILEKVTEINGQMDKSLRLLEERKKGDAGNQQRRIMKNTNDLALMFEESMQNMQQQMAQQMPGQQACEKPGQGKPKPGQGSKPMDKITQGQKELNGDMQKMKEGQPQKEGQDGEGSSEEFAKMAARQSALRKALQEKIKELQSKGKGSKELQDLANEMDKIETDLVNKRLTNEMLLRQKDIITRLLEAENAEREQEYEEKRQSKTATEITKEIPPAYQDYLKEREAQIEPFQNVSPALKAYYKRLVDAYYSSLKKG